MSDQERRHIRRLVTWGLIGLISAVGISIVASAFFIRPSISYPFFPFHFRWFGGIFLIFIIFFAARWLFWPWRWGYHPYSQYRGDAYHILKERYAKGEITKEQFEQMINDLKQHD